jgi:hypothetical protein
MSGSGHNDKIPPQKRGGILSSWRLPESNWGHTDFQSVALPTELKRRLKKWSKNITTFAPFVKKNQQIFFTFQYDFYIFTRGGADSRFRKTCLTGITVGLRRPVFRLNCETL